MKRKTILTDVDGVLLDWASGFDQWMLAQGYQHRPGQEHAYLINERFQGLTYEESKRKIREFNESEQAGQLKPLRDAKEGVHRLAAQGYTFGVITSHSNLAEPCRRREELLFREFGDVFESFHHLGTGDDKDDALLPYKGTGFWWIEDKTENAIAGEKVGLKTILMDHEHNNEDRPENVRRAYDWNDIVDIILLED